MGLTKRTYTDNVTVITAQNLNDIQDAIILLETAPSQGLSEEVKQAILQLAQKVAYIDGQGQTYYQALYNALYPPADLVSITAVYTQSGTVYPTTPLDDLKADLVVTGTYDDQSTATIPTSDYSLSGTLTVGTSTITVTSGGKTTTFTVNVTAAPTLSSISAVYTQSGIVLDTDTLDSLKSDLVVTATYSDSSTEVVDPDDYTLSGTLATGTSTITVSYAGKTTTFTVTVSGYVTDGLIMWLDGERNGVDGAHTPPMSTWVDQSGNGWDWDNMGATVSAQAISFSGSNYLKRAYNDVPTNVAMMEIVFSSPHTGSGLIVSGFGDGKPGNILMGSGNGVLFHTGTDKDTWTKLFENDWDGGVHSYSSGGYRDGVYDVASEAFSSSWQYLYPSIGCYLGSGGNNPQYQFKGSIYCIRMYSRVLTEAEILSNYAVDAARFGIGG